MRHIFGEGVRPGGLENRLRGDDRRAQKACLVEYSCLFAGEMTQYSQFNAWFFPRMIGKAKRSVVDSGSGAVLKGWPGCTVWPAL